MRYRVIRFGRFELDPTNFELRRDARRIKLDRKPFELLILLASRPGQLVTHEEAVHAVWGKQAVIEFDSALYTAIRKVRRALGDKSSRPRIIETVARKGYRFIATSAEHVRQAHSSGDGGESDRKMLAVLPLQNLSGDARHDYFSDGLTEDLIGELGSFSPHELGVIARTSVMRYKGNRTSAARIGAELGVEYLIQGSARHARGRVRIAVQLIRTQDQTLVWAGAFERRLNDVLQIQVEVARSVADSIRLKLAVGPRSLVHTDPAVYDLYLRGRYLCELRTAPANRRAIRLFESALRRDPQYAPAWAGLATCYATQAITSDVRPRDSFPLAREASERALALDPKLPEALIARGMTNFWFDWQWDAAEEDFRSASELNPSNPAARMFLAHLQSNLARHDAAIAGIRAGQRLDPVAPIMNTHEAHFLYNARRYDEAAEPLQRSLDLAPRFWVAHIIAGKIMGMRGQVREAIDEFAKAHRLSHGNTEAVGLRGYTLGASGCTADARRVLRELRARGLRRYVPPVHHALVHLGLGDREGVFDALEQAVEERDVRLTFLAIEPRWAPLLDAPRFERVRTNVGLPRVAASKA
ncbi:MAG TPA: winged helix-turn-helix domain-containing protein [Vicinamibacterales bacterium]